MAAGAVALLVLLLAPLSERALAESRRPNIVLIFIDAMGWTDAGYAGSDLYETPNVDRLRRQGKSKRDELVGDVLAWFERTEARLPAEPKAQYDPAARD